MPRFLVWRTCATSTVALALVAAALTTTYTDGPRRDGSWNEVVAAEQDPIDCPTDLLLQSTVPDAPDSCAHPDVPPPGVDVTDWVPTRVLEAREGAADAATDAAQDQGVPVAATHSVVTDRVACDGDGTSGYRVQAMYVVSADKPNRYASVADQIKQWAAGVDTVFNLSATKTGGVRNVRFVTAPNGDGTCSPTVLNITLPAGALNSFGGSITAMQQAGFTSPARKYLMWSDASVLCGIAQTYLSSAPGQDNPNNGYYPQFARTDTGCWGSSQSVEAHELSHTFGSVQGDAPHATSMGHCYDESDRMCYSDGGGKVMQQICTGDHEVLFDCRDDDYYSTYPAAGSYLASHWNTANSRFLIGGGDGTGGGSLGVPTRLGGTLAVNNPAVPGLATQVAVSVEVPAGRTTLTAWTASRADCLFADKTATQTTVTCDARILTPATVTVTVTDNTGEKVVRTSALTFDKTPRTAQASLRLDTSTSATYSTCVSGRAVFSTRVLDQASGAPVKGVTVVWLRTVGTAAPTQVATAVSGLDGWATSRPTLAAAGGYSAKTVALTIFPTTTSARTDVSVVAGTCATALTSAVDTAAVQAADPVLISGVATRTVPNGTPAPAAGESVSIYTQTVGSSMWTLAATAITGADGSYVVTLKPVASLVVQPRLKVRTGFAAATAPSQSVAVQGWSTNLSATPSRTSLMAADSVTVSGNLTASNATTTTPMATTALSVTYPIAGGKTATIAAKTTTTGAYTLVVRPTGSGTLTVRYAGKPGWSGATASSTLTVQNWTTAVTLTPSASTAMAGAPLTVTGILTQSGTPGTTPLVSTPVTVTYPIAVGKSATVNATTNVSGRYTVIVKPLVSGPILVRYAGKPGWVPTSASTDVSITQWATSLSLSGTRNASTGYVAATGVLTATDANGVSKVKPSASVKVTYRVSATQTATISTVTNATGQFTVNVKPGVSGSITAQYLGVVGWAASTAAPVTITVP